LRAAEQDRADIAEEPGLNPAPTMEPNATSAAAAMKPGGRRASGPHRR
jgi:hypothetical protein